VPGDNRFLGLNEHLHVASRHSVKGVFFKSGVEVGVGESNESAPSV
jgi:hypothetical protein